jgi:hypothetical protein
MRRALAIGLLALLSSGCDTGRRYDQAICALIDVSGTYADQKREAVKHLKREILPNMVPGDTLIVIRIDSESYQKDNVEALLTLEARPSHANSQKLALARKLDAFAAREHESAFTDIPGAMMLGAEYLREVGAGSRVMLVFSDMQEDLPKGARRQMSEGEFEGVQIVAMNVKRLDQDTADPEVFRRRIAAWEKRVMGRGALGWQTIMDPNKLPVYLAQVR